MSKDAIIGFHKLKNGNEAKLHADGSISLSSHPEKIQFTAEKKLLLKFQVFEMKDCIVFTVRNILDTEIGIYNKKAHSIDKLTYPHEINFVIPISDTELLIAGSPNNIVKILKGNKTFIYSPQFVNSLKALDQFLNKNKNIQAGYVFAENYFLFYRLDFSEFDNTNRYFILWDAKEHKESDRVVVISSDPSMAASLPIIKNIIPLEYPLIVVVFDKSICLYDVSNPDNPKLSKLDTSVPDDLNDCCITSGVNGSSLVFCSKNGETGNIPIPFLNKAVSYLVHESHEITGLPKSLNEIIANYYGFFPEKNSNSPEKRHNTIDLSNESELPGMVI